MRTPIDEADVTDNGLRPALSPMQAAKILGTTTARLADWRWKGGGPVFIKCGRRVIYASKDIRDFMERHRYSSTADHSARAKT